MKTLYFATKIVRKNCSIDREKLLKFEAEGREISNILRSLEQFILTVKGQNNFWQQNAFLTCSWRFLISKKLEQLEFRLEKIGWKFLRRVDGWKQNASRIPKLSVFFG